MNIYELDALNNFDKKLQNVYNIVKKFYQSKSLTGLIIKGDPGIGKTFTVEKCCKELMETDKTFSYLKIKGNLTPKGLYDFINNNNKLNTYFIFDDTDDILYNLTSLNILKAITDNASGNRVLWSSSRENSSVDFLGKVIILTNADFRDNPHLKAVLDRMYLMDLKVSDEEKLAKLKDLLLNIDKTSCSKEVYELILEFINKDFKELNNYDFSLRLKETILSIAELSVDYDSFKEYLFSSLKTKSKIAIN